MSGWRRMAASPALLLRCPRNPARVVPLFAWVGIDIVLWLHCRYLNSVASAGFNFIPALLGAFSCGTF